MKAERPTNLDITFGRDTSTTTVKRENCNKSIEELGVKINTTGDLTDEQIKIVKKFTAVLN
eukprot:9825234-Ditylum_brightwellii.AAC.1